MISSVIVIIILVSLTVWTIALFRDSFKWREFNGRTCHQCGSKRFSLVSKEPVGIHFTGGSDRSLGVGLRPTVQLRHKVTYRCPDCDAHWTGEITETRV